MKPLTTVWTVGAGLTALLALSSVARAAVDPTLKCHAGKLKESAKYTSCRLKAEAKAVIKSETPDFSKCADKFDDKFSDLEVDAGLGVCVTETDESVIGAQVIDDADDLIALLSGGIPDGCGDGVADGNEQCDGLDLDGQTCTGLGFSDGGTLACTPGCGFDTSACGCIVPEYRPASGQTASHGTGDDGDLQAGATMAFTDNGDGTISDLNTGLMWEKKVGNTGVANTCFNETGQCANPHHADNRYQWTASGTAFDGRLVTIFLEQLNDRCSIDPTVVCNNNTDCNGVTGPCGFAGYRDWRIPNAKELTEITSFGTFAPSVDTAFNGASCGAGCMDVTDPLCSCTFGSVYWSSTTVQDDSTEAWSCNFTLGGRAPDPKSFADFARAVRGGL